MKPLDPKFAKMIDAALPKKLLKGFRHWKRDGTPCSFGEFLVLQSDDKYVNVAKTTVGSTEVSTVWLGFDVGRRKSPLIFETMTFSSENDRHLTRRYATEVEARAGHHEVVRQLKEKN